MFINFLALMLPAALATMNPSTPRGEQIIPMANAKSEICVIPEKYPGADYSERDLKMEQKLCSYDNTFQVAMCAKLVSTNPAVEFFSIPEGMSAAQVEQKRCEVEGAKKLAKYKGSISCSYTPSLLAYYHVSRILGNVVQVPPVVLRTFDLNTHQKIASKANAVLAGNTRLDLLRQIWAGVSRHVKAPAKSSKKHELFTDDLKQSYGALQENPRKEEKYSEMFFGARGSETRADAFRARSPVYRLLADRRPLRSLVNNRWEAKSVQIVQQMKEVADMIVLDTMLNQQDRFGNVHYTTAYYFLDSAKGGMKVESKSKMDEADARSKNAVLIKEMMLKDNDCGVAKENLAKKARLLEGLSHISPMTYSRVLKLNRDLQQKEARDYFMKETMMTASDIQNIAKNLQEISTSLQNACRNGRLQLDLDLDGHFANTPLQQNCE